MTSTSDESDLKAGTHTPPDVQPQADKHGHHGLPGHHSHHHGHGRRFLNKITHPHTGRVTHVCSTPEDLGESNLPDTVATALGPSLLEPKAKEVAFWAACEVNVIDSQLKIATTSFPELIRRSTDSRQNTSDKN